MIPVWLLFRQRRRRQRFCISSVLCACLTRVVISTDGTDLSVPNDRGQPITTSAGKWLQLMLTISDVVDLSRFRFDLTYRVVRSDVGNLSPSASAVAQVAGFGSNVSNGASAILWYGDPVPGTLCSRNLHSCDQRTCIIQSPNFPGLYPRYDHFFSPIYSLSLHAACTRVYGNSSVPSP